LTPQFLPGSSPAPAWQSGTGDKLLKPFGQKSPRFGRGVFVAPTAAIIGDVSIGDFSSVWFNAIIRGDVNFVTIGSNSNVQDASVIHVNTGKFPTVIGDRVTVGHGCIIHGCTIQDECLIGMGAVILDGAEIGEGSVVASGSVVLQGARIPPRTLVAGVPAVKKKEIDERTLEEIVRSAMDYVELANEYLQQYP